MQEVAHRKKVTFSHTQAKPELALRLLDDLFSSPTDQKLVFSKETKELRNLLFFISRIKVRPYYISVYYYYYFGEVGPN